jgi:ribose transport system substrate-binding protein
MLRGASLGLAVAACLAMSGCGTAKPNAKYRIAVIPKGTTHVFWQSIHAGAEHAKRERGNVDIVWDGPAKEDQRHEQQQIVERHTTEGVDALILAPCDRETLVVPVEGALRDKIPVVIIDSGLQMTDAIRNSPQYLGYVATDNHQGGVEAAKRLLAVLKGKEHPKVLLLRYQKGSESTEQREAGFRETMRAASHVNFVEAPDEAGATVDTAQQVAERLLSDQKDIDGIFTPNESSTTGMLRALEVLGRAGQIRFVGFDSSEILINALTAGKLDGLVLQDPFDMGYQSVIRALDYLNGKPAPADKIKNTNLQVVTKENMNDPAIKPLYARDLKPYLGD